MEQQKELDATIEDLFEAMDLDFDSEDLGDYGGFKSLHELENPTSAIRALEQDFEKRHLICIPQWLGIPFNPQTGDRLPKGRMITTTAMKTSPDELIRAICDKAERNEEYKAKITKILKKNKDFEVVLDYNKETGLLALETFEAFQPFMNPYSVSAYTQRYKISEEKTITRRAIMPVTSLGTIDFDACDQDILARYQCEGILMAKEVAEKTAELEAAGASKKEIEEEQRKIRSNKVVTSPRLTDSCVGFAFDSDSSGELTSDAQTKYKDESNELEYSLRTFTVQSDSLTSITEIAKCNNYTSCDYIAVLRKIPAKSAEIANKGIAIGKVSYSALGTKTDINKMINKINTRIDVILKDGEVITADRIMQSVNKYGEIKKDVVLSCYSDGLGIYRRALSDKAFINNNAEALSTVSKDLGLKLIADTAKSNKVKITAKEAEEIVKDEAEEYSDTEDGADEVKIDASASDFV